MRCRTMSWVPVIVILALGACRPGGAPAPDKADKTTSSGEGVAAFKSARLIVEINATDGDAGLQLFLDHEPWRAVSLFHPDGSRILDVRNKGVLEDYGLTELFSESSEPSFEEFPLEEFKKLFPAGEYKLTGTTVDGKSMQSIVTLTHSFPVGPEITSPKEDSETSAAGLIVTWLPVKEPSGIEIAGYQVLVVREGEVVRTFSAELPPTATRVTVPPEFLESGHEYKVEVLAIEKGGNQTLSEIAFKVS